MSSHLHYLHLQWWDPFTLTRFTTISQQIISLGEGTRSSTSYPLADPHQRFHRFRVKLTGLLQVASPLMDDSRVSSILLAQIVPLTDDPNRWCFHDETRCRDRRQSEFPGWPLWRGVHSDFSEGTCSYGLWVQLLVTLGQFGDDSPVTGNRSVFNTRTLGEFKYRRFVEDQKANKAVCGLTLCQHVDTNETWPICSSNTMLGAMDSATEKPHSLFYSFLTVRIVNEPLFIIYLSSRSKELTTCFLWRPWDPSSGTRLSPRIGIDVLLPAVLLLPLRLVQLFKGSTSKLYPEQITRRVFISLTTLPMSGKF